MLKYKRGDQREEHRGTTMANVCEKLEKCPFYQGKMSMESGIGKMYKQKYCEGDKLSCARYMVATQAGPEFVTEKLYPNMVDTAKSIIEKNKK